MGECELQNIRIIAACQASVAGNNDICRFLNRPFFQVDRVHLPFLSCDIHDRFIKDLEVRAGGQHLCLGMAQFGGCHHFHSLCDLLGGFHTAYSVFNFLGGYASHGLPPYQILATKSCFSAERASFSFCSVSGSSLPLSRIACRTSKCFSSMKVRRAFSNSGTWATSSSFR